MTDSEHTVAFCPDCGDDFQIIVSEDEILVACSCDVYKPWIFVDELQDQLPLPTEQKFHKINKKKTDSEESIGFQ